MNESFDEQAALQYVLDIAMRNGYTYGDAIKVKAVTPWAIEAYFTNPTQQTRLPRDFFLLQKIFAQAYWGEKPYDLTSTHPGGDPFVGTVIVNRDGSYKLEIPAWQFHLQQAVISENVLEYYLSHDPGKAPKPSKTISKALYRWLKS